MLNFKNKYGTLRKLWMIFNIEVEETSYASPIVLYPQETQHHALK